MLYSRSNTFFRVRWLSLCALLLCNAHASTLLAQATNYLPGLVSQMTLSDGSTASRVDAVCAGKWASPDQYDERLTSGQPLKVRWLGALNVKVAGTYKLGLDYQGKATVQLDNAPLVTGTHNKPALKARRRNCR